jgi:hypothetical protein
MFDDINEKKNNHQVAFRRAGMHGNSEGFSLPTPDGVTEMIRHVLCRDSQGLGDKSGYRPGLFSIFPLQYLSSVSVDTQ